ncbi:MAG: hypothetical protein ACFB21_11965, partial [Opitutales bacterium]
MRWQITFHELWIGRRNSRLGWAVGPVQRQLCLALPKVLPSPVIHTHMTGYLERLSAAGLYPERLPLFGNIPLVPGAQVDPVPPGLPENAFVILHFGSITLRTELLGERLRELREEFAANGSACHFVSIGSAGPHKAVAERTAVDVFGEGHVHFIGIISAEQVSAWMMRAQVGLSRSPLHIYEKSGSTAAMLEHGLDVRLMSTEA